MGGASNLSEAAAGRGGGNGQPNFDLLSRIVSTMRVIYTWLTVLLAVVLSLGGTWALFKPMGNH